MNRKKMVCGDDNHFFSLNLSAGGGSNFGTAFSIFYSSAESISFFKCYYFVSLNLVFL
jgi:hypothetical protein